MGEKNHMLNSADLCVCDSAVLLKRSDRLF